MKDTLLKCLTDIVAAVMAIVVLLAGFVALLICMHLFMFRICIPALD